MTRFRSLADSEWPDRCGTLFSGSEAGGRPEDVVGARPAGRTTDTRISTNINYSTTSPVSEFAGLPKERGQPVSHHQSRSR